MRALFPDQAFFRLTRTLDRLAALSTLELNTIHGKLWRVWFP
jgi:hypothetical protein